MVTTGISIAVASVLTAMGERATPSQGQGMAPNPLIYLDVWLFGGLILVVLLVVAAKFVWNSLKPDDRDPLEGLQPWEDPDYEHDEDHEQDED